jgi:hypothetical protein
MVVTKQMYGVDRNGGFGNINSKLAEVFGYLCLILYFVSY